MENIQVLPTNDQLQDFDPTEFRPAASKSQSRSTTEPGVMSLIKSKNGKRVTLPKNLISKLGYPETLQVSFFDRGVAVSKELPNNETSFVVKESGNQFVIYSAPLVDEITEEFDLDFTGRSSMTFHNVSYINNEEQFPIALIFIN